MNSRFHILRRLFFDRLFRNEVLSLDLESAGLAHFFVMLGIPSAIIAASFGSQYANRDRWGMVGDQYFFVTYSFVVVALAALLQWEMLLPDRQDWLVLGPLPLPRNIIANTKLTSLGAYFGLVVAGANAFTLLMMPAIASAAPNAPPMWRMFVGQMVAVLWAGLVAAAGSIGVRALLALLPGARLRQAASVFAQTVGVAVLLNVLFTVAVLGSYHRVLLEKHLAVLRWLPTYWGVALQQYTVYGRGTLTEFLVLLRTGGVGSAVLIGASALAYLVAVRVQAFRLIQSPEDGPLAIGRLGGPGRLLGGLILRDGREFATFRFISSVLARSPRHRMYLSSYIGFGLACAVPAIIRLGLAGPIPHVIFSPKGLLNATLVLSFCLISGLRMAFAFPVQLRANWIFIMTQRDAGPYLNATLKWVIACAVVPLFLALLPLHLALWPTRLAFIHWTSGIIAAWFMTEGLFWKLRVIPFTAPPPPRRPATVVRVIIYMIVFPPFVLSATEFELWTAATWAHTTGVFAAALALFVFLRVRRVARVKASPSLDFEQLPPETMVHLNLAAVGDQTPLARNS